MVLHDSSETMRFRALVQGLCQDSGIRLEIDRRFFYDPTSHAIHVDGELINRSIVTAAAITAHEAGHVWITRYLQFRSCVERTALWAHFQNAIEDPRANLYIRRRMPGTTRWFSVLSANEQALPPPQTSSRFELWCVAAAKADVYSWAMPDWFDDHPEVEAALLATASARREYAETLPPHDTGHVNSATALWRSYRLHVHPDLRVEHRSVRPSEWEALVRVSAARARLLAKEIFEHVEPLIEADTQKIGHSISSSPALATTIRDALADDRQSLSAAVAKALSLVPGRDGNSWTVNEMSERLDCMQVAADAFDAYISSHSGSQDEHGVAGRPGASDRHRLFDVTELTGSGDHSAISPEVSRQVPDLLQSIKAVLQPDRPEKLRAGHASGLRVDLRRAMAFEADPRQYNRLWLRRGHKGESSAAISLLVDLSGSMTGAKIRSAVNGTLLFALTLRALDPHVAFAINGFQDKLIEVKSFDVRATNSVLIDIQDMALEVSDRRPGGNNVSGCNDDGPCLLEAAAQLLLQPQKTKILIIVSDGCPAGLHSDADDLVSAVSRLSDPSIGLKLFALGLGPGTEHVRDFYPHAIADIETDKLATEIGNLLEGELVKVVR